MEKKKSLGDNVATGIRKEYSMKGKNYNMTYTLDWVLWKKSYKLLST